MVFPTKAPAANSEQPYTFDLPAAGVPDQKFQIELQFMGHYNERNVKLTINMEELTTLQSIVYEMVMDSQSGNWELVLMHDADRNMVGVAEFTQGPVPPTK